MEGENQVVVCDKAKAMAQELFAKFDADHNQSIEKDEFKPSLVDFLKKAHVTKV